MPQTKNALIRYQALDRCFRNTGRIYFLGDLLEECNKALEELDPESAGIQKRQLYDDIRFMESEQGWSIPLGRYRSGKKVYYRYEDPSFSINNQPLNLTEVEQIRSALQIIARFSGTPQFEWVNEMIPMLESKLGLIDRKREAISFDSNIDLKGVNFLTPLFNAIINERALSVTYQDFKSPEPYGIAFHPHFLKQYNNRWFAFGLNEETAAPNWNLAIDRIVELSEREDPYEPSTIDWEEYFYDIVGVTRTLDATPEPVVLRFSSGIAPYVITKPLHPSQKSHMEPGGLLVTIQVIPNFELETLVLSFGEHVVVVSPTSFRERIRQRLHASQMLE